jgi:16S rRNA (cytidine1402-2'-O)-methyltransferase
VDVNPGASSLMALLALSGVKLDRFYFAGFLPAETEQRERKILELKKICGSEEVPFVIMDTPYRLNKVLGHLSEHFGDREAVLGLELTTGSQEVSMARLSDLAKRVWPKAPFVLLVGA